MKIVHIQVAPLVTEWLGSVSSYGMHSEDVCSNPTNY